MKLVLPFCVPLHMYCLCNLCFLCGFFEIGDFFCEKSLYLGSIFISLHFECREVNSVQLFR